MTQFYARIGLVQIVLFRLNIFSSRPKPKVFLANFESHIVSSISVSTDLLVKKTLSRVYSS